MGSAKTLMRDLLPPAMLRLLRRTLGTNMHFEGEFATWEEARSHCSGYDAKEILARVLAATLKVKNGEVAFERDAQVFDEIEYAWSMLAGLMWAAARDRGSLNVLDFGGSLGSSYFQNRKFLRALPGVQWNVVEQAHFVEAGQKYVQDEVLRFYRSIEACLMENKPNVILLSSVLQYLDAPFDVLRQLSDVKASIMIVDRTPFSPLGQDRILIQRVPPSIYPASYPMRVFSKSVFMNAIHKDWRVVTATQSPEGRVCSKNGLEFSFEGMLLESR